MEPLVFVVYPGTEEVTFFAQFVYLCECPDCGATWRAFTGPMGAEMACYRCGSERTQISEPPQEEEEGDHGDVSLN